MADLNSKQLFCNRDINSKLESCGGETVANYADRSISDLNNLNVWKIYKIVFSIDDKFDSVIYDHLLLWANHNGDISYYNQNNNFDLNIISKKDKFFTCWKMTDFKNIDDMQFFIDIHYVEFVISSNSILFGKNVVAKAYTGRYVFKRNEAIVNKETDLDELNTFILNNLFCNKTESSFSLSGTFSASFSAPFRSFFKLFY